MTINNLESKLNELKSNEAINDAFVDDFNDYEASIYIKPNLDNKKNSKRQITLFIKKYFRENFNAKFQLNIAKDGSYFFNFQYSSYFLVQPKVSNSKKTLIFSNKLDNEGLYIGDKTFKKNVLETLKIANSKDSHIELLENIYPEYTIVPLYTFEHSGFSLDTYKRCRWDSSEDAFAAFKTKEDFDTMLKEINESISF